jgi:hypothetical protein
MPGFRFGMALEFVGGVNFPPGSRGQYCTRPGTVDFGLRISTEFKGDA